MKGREMKKRAGKGRQGENDLTHPLLQNPGYATGPSWGPGAEFPVGVSCTANGWLTVSCVLELIIIIMLTRFLWWIVS